MRISDWSSDVCSSDLRGPAFGRVVDCRLRKLAAGIVDGEIEPAAFGVDALEQRIDLFRLADIGRHRQHRRAFAAREIDDGVKAGIVEKSRSEEHTSELQSLMRISYAVFCLKKKKQ